MIKFDKNYKNELVFKSNYKNSVISLTNKSNDKIDYPYWLPINNKNKSYLNDFSNPIVKFLEDKKIDCIESVKRIYFFYSDNQIKASSVLSYDFFNEYLNSKMPNSLFVGFFDTEKKYPFISSYYQTNKENIFFVILPLIEYYEFVITDNKRIITNSNPEKNFIRFNITDESEYLFMKDNILSDSIFYNEFKNYTDFTKIKKESIIKNKKEILSILHTLNQIILKNENTIKAIGEKYKKEYEEPFIPTFFINVPNKRIKRQLEILKYYQISPVDYSIYPYLSLKSILFKNGEIETDIITEDTWTNEHYFSESGMNIIIDYACFNVNAYKDVMEFIYSKIKEYFKSDIEFINYIWGS